MKKFTKIVPWFIAVGISWFLGYLYNVHYGGELSFLRRMYEQKKLYAASIEKPNRILVIGGSGAHYSINAKLMQEKLGLPVFNYGLQGDIGLNVLFPMILEQVRPGDIVLAIPEYLMLLDEDGINRGDGLYASATFGLIMGKPGLGGVPMKELGEYFWLLGMPNFRPLIKSSVELIQDGKMTGYLSDPITELGDPTVEKIRKSDWWKMKIRKPVSDHSLKRIAEFKKELEAKDATLVLALPWIYAEANESGKANVRKTAEQLKKIAPLLYNERTLNIQQDSDLFADTHYHLKYEGQVIRSNELVEQLRPLINSSEINKNTGSENAKKNISFDGE